MKKYLFFTSLISLLLLTGCGGGDDDSSSSISSLSVTVERGPVYGATVTDSSDPIQTAIQNEGENIYVFENTPVYPISAIGGIIDIDGNGIDEGDIELNQELTSYSNVITPITDYLGDTSADEGKQKLKDLKDNLGISFNNDDLTNKVPSQLNTNIIVLSNTLFDAKIKGTEESDLKSKFDELKTLAEQNPDNIIETLENQIIFDNNISVLSALDAKIANFSKKTLLNKKLVNANETYFFRKNDIVRGDTGDDYTEILSYGEIKDGTLKAMSENGNYNLISVQENGYKIEMYTKTSNSKFTLIETVNISEELSTYTKEELQTALDDVEVIIYSWETNQWGDCQGECGTDNATQIRTVQCKASNEQIVEDSNCTDTKPELTQNCTASICNIAPTANAGTNQTVTEGETVTLDASSSSDSDGNIVSYSWMEGTTSLSTQSSFTKSDFSIGSHTITLTVIDDDGESASDNITITVNKGITYSWEIGDWRTCQGECGTNKATQTRIVQCEASSGATVTDNLCSATKPATSKSCTASECGTANLFRTVVSGSTLSSEASSTNYTIKAFSDEEVDGDGTSALITLGFSIEGSLKTITISPDYAGKKVLLKVYGKNGDYVTERAFITASQAGGFNEFGVIQIP